MILEYLQSALGEGTSHPNTSRGAQHSFKCPFCSDHKERFFVHWQRQVFYCHNCETTGSLVTFISDYAQISWYDALDVYRQYQTYEFVLPDNLQEEVYARLMPISETIRKEKYVHPLPEEFILIEEASGRLGNKAIEYLKSRGISRKMAEKYYIGYCGAGEYENRIIMPDFEQGDLVYWQARTWEPPPTNEYAKKFYRKVLNPKLPPDLVEAGVSAVDKSEILGNIDSVLETRTAIICEGKMDQYTIGNSGCCIHGKHMSDMQFTKLISHKNDIDLMVVMLDGDALKAAIATAARLYKHYDEVWIARMPKDKDPNTLGPKGIVDCLGKMLPYNDMFAVKARLSGWI